MNSRTLALIGIALALFIFRDKIKGFIVNKAGNLFDPIRAEIEKFEGRRNYAYQDSAGKWTIGVGHLIVLPQEQDLLNYTQDNPAPDDLINTLFDKDVAAAKGIVASQVTVPITDNQRAALVSLAYNIGPSAFANSTLLKLLNQGKIADAGDAFLQWKYAGGQPVLLSRREDERALFLSA